jgi:hypothetical protein
MEIFKTFFAYPKDGDLPIGTAVVMLLILGLRVIMQLR